MYNIGGKHLDWCLPPTRFMIALDANCYLRINVFSSSSEILMIKSPMRSS